jgi:hypothetical protein
VDEQQITEIIRQAARIVEEAKVTEQLGPCAFRVAAEALLQGAIGEYAGLETRSAPKAELLEGVAVNQFLVGIALRSHVDRFVAIAYYLLHSKGQLTFNVRDLEEVYTLARDRKPKNFAAIASQCAGRGLFTEAGEKLDSLKGWQITKTGEAHVRGLVSDSPQD